MTKQYYVQGLYQVQYPNGKQSRGLKAHGMVQAESELKAIMAMAKAMMADCNYRMFLWLHVSAQPVLM